MDSLNLYLIDRKKLIEQHYRTLYHQLNNQEQSLIKPWHEQRRLEYIAGRGFLRMLLGQSMNREGVDVPIRTNEFGKPIVDGDIFFNLSHSGDYVVIAISTVKVGVDIEDTARKKDWKKLLERFFHEEEKKCVQNQKDFYHLWTKKEALLKCVGIGLTQNLDSFRVDQEVIKYRSRDYFFSEIPLPDGICGHLCMVKKIPYQIKNLSEVKFL